MKTDNPHWCTDIFKHSVTITFDRHGIQYKNILVYCTDEYLELEDKSKAEEFCIVREEDKYGIPQFKGRAAYAYTSEMLKSYRTENGILIGEDKPIKEAFTKIAKETHYKLIHYGFGVGSYYGIFIDGYVFAWELGTATVKPMFNKLPSNINYEEVEPFVFFKELGKIISCGYVLENRQFLDDILFDFYCLCTTITDGCGDHVLESKLLNEFKTRLLKEQSEPTNQCVDKGGSRKVCTFVGSREAPIKAEELGVAFLKKFLALGNSVWSGGSGVMDKCVEHAYFYNKFRGVPQGEIKVFLPWFSFDSKLSYQGLDRNLYIDIGKHEIHDTAKIIAKSEYDRYNSFDNLKKGAQSLMTRNSCQVLDETCDHLSDFLMCWAKPANTKNMTVQGGTNLAVAIAKKHEVPILNLYHPWVFEAVSAYTEGYLTLQDLLDGYSE